MAMIFEPYLDCYSSIFSPNSVCRSWDYGLSAKWSPIFNRMSGTWLNFQFVLLKHITLICQHDKLPLVRWYATQWHITYCICTNIIYLFIIYFLLFILYEILGPWYLKNRINNHVEIFTVSLSLSGIENLLFSVWSLNHDVIQAPFCVLTLSLISSYPFIIN